MKYRPEIDGLRAIAVIPVILFHAGFEIFKGGYIGVDIFFVISGFLITSIIINGLNKNSFSIITFYEKRARRIMPMLFLIMIISILGSWFLFFPSDFKSFSNSLIAVPFFSSNFLFWLETDYWDIFSELKPLLHTWSLAVEEQYYIFFPLILMFLHRFKPKWIFGSVIIIAIASLVVSEYSSHHYKVANFYLIPTRSWELCIGSIIGILYTQYPITYEKLLSRKKVNETLSLLGFLMILISIFFFNEHTRHPSTFTLLPTLGTGLVILFSSQKVLIGRVLSLKPLVKIGLISYSIYLLHQPLFAFARYYSLYKLSPFFMFTLVLAVILLSYFSWRYIETPFRNKVKFNRKKIFLITGIGSLSFILIGIIGIYTEGFSQRNHLKKLKLENYNPDNDFLKVESWGPLRDLTNDPDYFIENNLSDQKLWFDDKNNKSNLLLIGNSHSKDIFNILTNSESTKKRFEIARYGLQIRHLNNFSHKLFNSKNYLASDFVMIASKYNEKDILTLEKLILKLKKDNKKIIIVEEIFPQITNYKKTIADSQILEKIRNSDLKLISKPDLISKINNEYYNNYKASTKTDTNDQIIKLGEKHSDVFILDRIEYICNKSSKEWYAVGSSYEKFFYDYGHHTIEGAKFYGNRVDEIDWLKQLNQ